MAPVVPSKDIRPQPGPQELFLSCPADVGIIGGSVYGGKSWSLVVEPLRHVHVPGFNFAIFRREIPDITNPGGLWDETQKWYPDFKGQGAEHVHEWSFPSGAWGKLAGCQYEKDLAGWKGSQICLLEFDQLETFTERQFWFLLARNRSLCGVQPYCRASVNPDPESFLAQLLAWWIDQETGYSIPERSGAIRWFLRVGDTVEWSATVCWPEDYPHYPAIQAKALAEMISRYGEEGTMALSLSYVLARLQDNKIGQQLDPSYEAKVRALPYVERERLLGGDKGGNWKIKAVAGLVFNRAWFPVVDAIPVGGRWVRFWDFAGTEGGGKYTCGVLLGEIGGTYYVRDVVRGQVSFLNRQRMIRETAERDGKGVPIRIEQEPGSAGKDVAALTVMDLAGWDARFFPATGDKFTRAGPFAAQAEAGNVKVLRGPWTDAYLAELHAAQPGAKYLDQMDASSGAFNFLASRKAAAGMPVGVGGGGGWR